MFMPGRISGQAGIVNIVSTFAFGPPVCTGRPAVLLSLVPCAAIRRPARKSRCAPRKDIRVSLAQAGSSRPLLLPAALVGPASGDYTVDIRHQALRSQNDSPTAAVVLPVGYAFGAARHDKSWTYGRGLFPQRPQKELGRSPAAAYAGDGDRTAYGADPARHMPFTAPRASASPVQRIRRVSPSGHRSLLPWSGRYPMLDHSQ